jgi:hypothetical protein
LIQTISAQPKDYKISCKYYQHYSIWFKRMNYQKIALLVALGLTATSCGGAPSGLSPSVAPTNSSPVTTPATTPSVAPSIPASSPVIESIPPVSPSPFSNSNPQVNSSDRPISSPPPRRKKNKTAKKLVNPSPAATSSPPSKKNPASKPARDEEDDSDVLTEEKPKKTPPKPVKTRKGKESNVNGEDAVNGDKTPSLKPKKITPDGSKPPKPPADAADGKNQEN